ncbi:MAG TPA: hypothetical protein VF131_23535 [Blastocatellia bacterium]|nr:hypothetical protein [Blastocatellia bacterium]
MDRPFELEEKRPQVAVVGAGYRGFNHVRNFYELGARSVVCDTSSDSLLRIKEKTLDAAEASLSAGGKPVTLKDDQELFRP